MVSSGERWTGLAHCVEDDLGFAVHRPRMAMTGVALESDRAAAAVVRRGDEDPHRDDPIVGHDERREQHDVAQPGLGHAREAKARQQQVEVTGAGQHRGALDAMLVDDPVVPGVQ